MPKQTVAIKIQKQIVLREISMVTGLPSGAFFFEILTGTIITALTVQSNILILLKASPLFGVFGHTRISGKVQERLYSSSH